MKIRCLLHRVYIVSALALFSFGCAGSVQDSRPAHPLESELEASCAGKTILNALREERGGQIGTGLSMLANELESAVNSQFPLLADSSSPLLPEAAKSLRRLPRFACQPIAAVMALIDEWTAKEAGMAPGHWGRFIEQIRKDKPPRDDNLDLWLKRRYPILHKHANRILGYLI